MRLEVTFRVKRNFDILHTRFGAIFMRAFKIIEEENLVAIKRFLSEAFQDTRDQVKDVESMDQLEKVLRDHTSFTDFPMLEGLAYTCELKAVEKELVSFVEYRKKMYAQMLDENFDVARIDEYVKNSQTKVGTG